MNSRQLWYQANRVFSGNSDLSFSAMAMMMAADWIRRAAIGSINPIALPFQALLILYTGRIGYYGLKSRLSVRGKKEELNDNPGEYYFAESGEVVISHREGLEMLLEKTSERKWGEWGTVLNAHEEGKKAVIHGITAPEEAERLGIIRKKLTRIIPKITSTMDFDGLHHYHPWCGSSSYSINPLDRNLPEGWINLLTFNTGGRPEVIAYNIRYTYIPANKDDKSRLVRATPAGIMKYLAQ
ncbi:MAG TPA: hypothetical protein HA362_04700 [Nanoarchaeota archaeon]|nr:hypothetical protein [Nanoarchaeota archaeon]